MDTDTMRDFCLSLKQTTEDIKWDHLCFCVGAKMYIITGFEDNSPTSFKVPEEDFDALTSREGIVQAAHFAKRQWVTVMQRNKLKPKEWEHYINQSYEMVKQKLTKKLRGELGL
ncbi:MmcQ/YjbR family DNA-binding protein [Taibaiella soli]|uniref:MmcQ/YjbR family DNA-binding protein n=1 Tax=Taibaiella soli TaxID=1649169 RepID=A0A2W2AQ09_9BACT|nr:MmcQ/YjbR family DNA-binding protein [Taibaiella soli]PZF74500.1 hypothetical protein DN068_02680 [Taibaiella soli]